MSFIWILRSLSYRTSIPILNWIFNYIVYFHLNSPPQGHSNVINKLFNEGERIRCVTSFVRLFKIMLHSQNSYFYQHYINYSEVYFNIFFLLFRFLLFIVPFCRSTSCAGVVGRLSFTSLGATRSNPTDCNRTRHSDIQITAISSIIG